MIIKCVIYQTECDGCGECLDNGLFESREECREVMKLMGWKSIKNETFCPDCLAKLKKERNGKK